MLVFLDDSLLKSLDANPSPFTNEAIAIDLAAEAARQGSHILCGDIKTFDGLIAKDSTFNARTRSLLTRARTKTPFRQDLLDNLLWFVRITSSVSDPIIQKNSIGQTEILLPPTAIALCGGLLNKARFIPENDNDGHFYEAITYQMVEIDPYCKQHYSSVRLRFELTQGGGSTTSAVYALAKARKTGFCLAVVDSDQTYPGGPIGPTAAAVQTVDAPPNSPEWNARSVVLSVRAVENLFPQSALLQTSKELDEVVGNTAAAISSTLYGSPLWNYLPLKSGIKCFEIKRNQSPEEKYLVDATSFGRCPNHSGIPCADKGKCNTYVVPPLSGGLLAQLCKTKPMKLNLSPVVDVLALPTLKALCREMISAFCGDEPILG